MLDLESWNIKGGTLEYIDSSHTYIYDGVVLPSVTQALKTRFCGKYDGIPAETMKRASERGTRVHKAIENYCITEKDDGSDELRNYKFLEKYYKFKSVKNELPVVLFKDGAPICAGRLDLVLKIGNRGIDSILVEGGGIIHDAFLRNQLVQRIHAYIAPIVIGGQHAKSAVSGFGFEALKDAPRFKFKNVQQIGDDIYVEGEL